MKTYLLIGDSRISLIDDSSPDPRMSIGHVIETRCPVKINNAASGGMRMSRMNNAVGAVAPALSLQDGRTGLMVNEGFYDSIAGVICLCGYNDWKCGDETQLDRHIEAYTEVGKYFLQTGNEFIIVTELPALDDEGVRWFEGGPTLDDYRTAQSGVADYLGVPCVHGPALMPNEAAYFGGPPHLNNLGQYTVGHLLTSVLQGLGVFPPNY